MVITKICLLFLKCNGAVSKTLWSGVVLTLSVKQGSRSPILLQLHFRPQEPVRLTEPSCGRAASCSRPHQPGASEAMDPRAVLCRVLADSIRTGGGGVTLPGAKLEMKIVSSTYV